MSLTREKAHEAVDEAAQLGALRYLASHWGYCFNDDSEWSTDAEGAQALHDFVDIAAEDQQDRRASGRNPKDSDPTGLEPWDGVL